ncbi:MAG: toll/interleukin-1 receptor domain-containing protein [Anaerolineae bacterium]|nr:toll/interleukin-1 receptor domain-containing protein [Anaerolineae bacterium]
MSHIFISYSKKDIDFARHLRGLLNTQGFDVWMDETRLVPAERWPSARFFPNRIDDLTHYP